MNIKISRFAGVIVLAVAFGITLFGQDDKFPLKEGSEVSLIFADNLSSKTSVVDDKVNFTLDEDLKSGDTIVAKKGTKAVGTVTAAKKAGMMGRGGELSVRLEYI